MRQQGEAFQRLRVRFGRGGDAAYISHLDLMRFWERALRRAGLPLAYSQGFSPHPRISIAAPLPLGVTSEAELMDVYLSRWIAPHNFTQALRAQMPPGVLLFECGAVPAAAPSLQSQVRFAEYRVAAARFPGPEDATRAVEQFMAAQTLMWQHTRDTEVRSYDLRQMVSELAVKEVTGAEIVLNMVLRCDPGGSGRPEQVTAAIGFAEPPISIHRTRLALEAPRPAPQATFRGARNGDPQRVFRGARR